jgi:hypothetical protein
MVWLSSVASSRPDRASQILIVRSRLLVARRSPSDEKATVRALCRIPLSTYSSMSFVVGEGDAPARSIEATTTDTTTTIKGTLGGGVRARVAVAEGMATILEESRDGSVAPLILLVPAPALVE